MKTSEIIKKAIQDYIDEDQKNYEIYLKIFAALKKHDGEKITKRFATTVEKALGPDYSVFYKHQYGMYNVEVKLKSEHYDKYRSFLLGHDSNPGRPFRLQSGDPNASKNSIYSERGFDYHAACYGEAAKRRIEENKKFLKSGKVEKLADLHDMRVRVKSEMRKIKDFPARYAVEKKLGF